MLVRRNDTGSKTAQIRRLWDRTLKTHMAVDIKEKRILSLEVTGEEVHDGKMLKDLVDKASENNNLKGILADGMWPVYLCRVTVE